MVVLGCWLDLMIFEVFSNLNDPIYQLSNAASTGESYLQDHAATKDLGAVPW